jgi:diguanylate cyclase (GGDEF)-like protein/PAS domain S-box-containing protein
MLRSPPPFDGPMFDVASDALALFDLAHEAILIRDLEGRLLYVNPEAEDLYGHHAESARGTLAHELLATVFPVSRAAVEATLLARDRWAGDLIQTRSDGRRLQVSSRQALQRDEHGEPRIVLELNRDVTERRVGERELADRERAFRLLVESSTAMHMHTTTAGDILYASPVVRAVLGYEPQEVVGRNVAELLHPDVIAILDERRRLADASDGAIEFESQMRSRDGHWIWLHGTLRAERDASGTVIKRQFSAHPLGHPATAGADAAGRTSLFRALARNVDDGVALFDRELRIVAADPAVLNALHVAETNPEGRLVRAAAPELADELEPRARLALAGAESRWRLRAADGRLQDVRVVPVRGEDGGVVCGMILAEDVDDRVRHAAEQHALHEIAVAVAGHTAPPAVFELVANTVRDLFTADAVAVVRFHGGDGTVVGSAPETSDFGEPGTTFTLDPDTPIGRVERTGQTWALAAEADASPMRRPHAAAPISVRRRLWGALVIASADPEAISPEVSDRLERFAELVATAVASAEAWDTLAHVAAADPLTGLPNHRTFQEHLRTEVKRARRYGRELSLVLLDLDGFREINDALGHHEGDRVLAEAARRIAEQARAGELVARVGGEEFGWILPEVDAANALIAADRVRQELERRPVGNAGTVTLSAGVCSLADAEDAEGLVRLADCAVHWAKRSGRNATVRYSETTRLVLADNDTEQGRYQSMSAIRALARAIDAKDLSTREHSERVAEVAVRLALQLGWTARRARLLRDAGLLHDVGKIGIPDQILLKPGRLTAAEYDEVKRHPALSAQIASEVLEDEQVRWVRGHHERWDGGGYPDGLADDAIPDGAQLLGLADAWDVMTTSRTYQTPRTLAEALDECRVERGAQFAPAAVDALLVLHERGELAGAVRPDAAASAAG